MLQRSLSRKSFSLKYIGLYILCLFITITALAQPTISSFSPTAAPAGANVTITGTGFNTTPANNIVFFGAVKATVTAASATSLTVTVPAGATYQPITVTVNNLTAYSSKLFIVTFTGAAPEFTSQSFEYATRIDSVDSNIETTKYAIGDVDNDDRIDVVTIDRLNNKMSVYRNTTTSGIISFAAKTDFTTGQSPRSVSVGDIDGDGKLDVVVSNLSNNTVSVFKNTSTTGSISFATKVDFSTATQPAAISITDLDKDGKPDLVVNTVNIEGYVSVLRNTSNSGTISFAPKVDLQATGGSIEEIRTADIDGDAMYDIVLPNYSLNKITIFRNTSTPGNLSFAPKVDIGSNASPTQIEIADLNDDGKPDIALVLFYSSYVYTLRNNSTPGVISFIAETNHWINGRVNSLAVNDLNGDGKPDLAFNNATDAVALYQNKSSAGGAFSFAPGVMFQSPWNHPIITGDFDADGKPDMAFKSGLFRVTVWKNRMTSPHIFSFSPAIGSTGDTITIQGVNFRNINAVSFGRVAVTSFEVVDETKIKAVLSSGATGDVVVKTSNDSARLSGFLFTGPPSISSFTPGSAVSYEKITIKGHNFTGTSEVKLGGTTASFDLIDPFTIEAYVGKGSSGDVTVTNTYGTASKPGFTYIPKPFITSFSPSQIITGSTITITGLNLSTVTSISLGGTQAASFTIIDSVTIKAVVGAGSSGDLIITNPHGTAVKSGLTYYPPPVITSFTPTEAAQGDTVTISGRNFSYYYNNSYITAVKFGNAYAFSSTVIDSFTIKARVNFGASGAVTVESDRGNSSLDGFTFIPPPSITSVNPRVVGAGSEVTIIGTNLSRVTAVTFGDVPASSITVVSPDTIKAVVANGATGSVVVATRNHSTSGFSVSYVTANPVIHHVFPLSGPIGTIVTITGANFQSTPTGNIVYFGGVKATVITASPNTLTVAVPVGATYQPITVTSLSNRLTAQSNKRFTVTFPVDANAFNDSSFAGNMDFVTGLEPYDFKQGDLDGDGKLDIVVINHGSTFLSLFRNVSTPGKVIFSSRIDKEIGINAKAVAIADMDGDGKLDLIVSSDGSNPRIFIYRNQSTAGNIDFVNAYEIGGLYYNAGFIETADFNLDGRIDIVFLCTNCSVANGGIFVIQNLSNSGALSFSSATLHSSGVSTGNAIGTTAGLAITDFQNDGKPDVIVGLWGSSALFFFQNNSRPETFINFSVSTKGDLSSSDGYYSLTPYTGNFQSNEFADLVSNKFVYKNSNGVYSKMLETFAIATGVYDLNGDGMQDILGNHLITGKLSLIKNTSKAGTVTFAPSYDCNVNGGMLTVGDLDGDSKPEICIIYPYSNMLRILRNRMGESAASIPSISSFSPTSGTSGTIITIKGANFYNVTNISFGGVAASSFTVADSTTITAVVASGASGIVAVTTAGGSGSMAGFTFTVVTAVNNISTNSKELTVNPNPANDIITIKHPSSTKAAHLKIIDISGRTVKTIVANRNQNQTSVSVIELHAGFYHLLWSDGTKQLHKSFIVIK